MFVIVEMFLKYAAMACFTLLLAMKSVKCVPISGGEPVPQDGSL